MSPEWMIAIDSMCRQSGRKEGAALADPLEGAEWRGLERVVALLSLLSARRGRRSPAPSRRAAPDPTLAAQGTPFRF